MRKIIIRSVLLISGTFIFSCAPRQEHEHQNLFTPVVVEAKNFAPSNDSVHEPRIVRIAEVSKIAAPKPVVVPANNNVVIAREPEVKPVGKPQVNVPGQGGFLLPEIIPALDSHLSAGIPEVLLAKDAYIKDQNPKNFSSFSKLQGLRQDNIRSIFRDRSGNLWIGTSGGGVSKYDGRFFTHFTEKQGLLNNNVWEVFEDRAGNMWFGTDGGINKYDGKTFTHFTTKEGVTGNSICCILQDKNGNMWFATGDGGVSKYDGRSFTNYTEKQGLPNNSVWSLLEDNEGNIWCGTDLGGASKFDGHAFTNYTVREGLTDNAIYSMLKDSQGNIWLGTHGGASKFDGRTFKNYTNKEGLISSIVMSMLEDKEGNIWFGTYEGLSKFDGNRVDAIESGGKMSSDNTHGLLKENGKFTRSFENFSEKEGLNSSTVWCMLEDKTGNIWFGTYGAGISKYDGKSFTHITQKEGLSSNKIFSISEDKSGNLWFGLRYGTVTKYDGKSFSHYNEKGSLSNHIVWCVLEDTKGNFWFGTDGGGVAKYDGKSYTHYTEKEGLANNTVKCMLEDKQGNIWFGTYNGVTMYDGNRAETVEAPAFTNFTEAEGLINNSVSSIMEDKEGSIWFGTYGGVSIYQPQEKRKPGSSVFRNFTEKEGLINNNVLSILEEKNGNIWFGTNGGVCRYDGNASGKTETKEGSAKQNGTSSHGKSFIHFTEKQGLSNNVVPAMLEDRSGNLWFGTRNGLSRISAKNKAALSSSVPPEENNENIIFRNYTYEDGFLGIGVNAGITICEDRNNTIWIAANDRLTAYHPTETSEGESSDTISPNIQLTSLALFNENIQWANLTTGLPSPDALEQTNLAADTSFTLGNGVKVGDFWFYGITKWYGLPEGLSLAHNNNYLTFNFIGITLTQPKKVKYKYKLEGLDENWSAITNRTEAAYGNLAPGTYAFKVKAMNSEGYWSDESSYSFTIRPPWWKTWWFRTGVALFAIASIWYYIKSREKKLVLEKETLERTVVERTKEVVEEKKTVEEQKYLIEEKSEKLGAALKDITDSINYALRIQQAILPDKKEVYKTLSQCFILFKPKDIVSGDFYFFHKKNELIFIAAVDCTGHGVPGAFMSMVGSERLSDAVQQTSDTTEILSLLNKGVKTSLKQSDKDESTRDGMDIALCCIDLRNSVVKYTGANRPIWLIRKNSLPAGTDPLISLEEIKPTKAAIGGLTPDGQHFASHEIQLSAGDTFYICTDGYADQFSGHNGKKLMTKKLKEILVSIQHLTMQEQEIYLENFVEKWRSGVEQVDDILVIGIRI
jgi:ligand-binding sensor domain-containing protein/serine phosphatase RsbU (regulator of sigma subunit)